MQGFLDFLLDHIGDISLCLCIFLSKKFGNATTAEKAARKQAKLEKKLKKNLCSIKKNTQELEEVKKLQGD